jgi:hypothetical protein
MCHRLRRRVFHQNNVSPLFWAAIVILPLERLAHEQKLKAIGPKRFDEPLNRLEVIADQERIELIFDQQVSSIDMDLNFCRRDPF